MSEEENFDPTGTLTKLVTYVTPLLIKTLRTQVRGSSPSKRRT